MVENLKQKLSEYFSGIWQDQNFECLQYSGYQLVNYVNDQTPSSVIDIGCGYNRFKGKIKNLHAKGCENLVILPLYPQYAAATTATVCDEVYRSLMKMRWQPSIKIIPHYESHPLYILSLIHI